MIALVSEGAACRLAVGSGGNIFIVNGNGGGVNRFTTVGFQQSLAPSGISLGIDPSDDHVYVGDASRVTEYLPDGTKVSDTGVGVPYDQTGIGTLGYVYGVAVRGSTGRMYVADRTSNRIAVYGPLDTFPDVSTGSASAISRTAAALSGHVASAGGDTVDCEFEWGLDATYGHSQPCDQALPISGAADVSAHLAGLTPGSTYHYRIVAGNSAGSTPGADMTFETPFVDGVTTAAATAIARDGAMLNGSLEPNGVEAHYYFEWGGDTSYGNMTPAPPGTSAGAGSGATPATAGLTGLTPATSYHFRLVAENSQGITYGPDMSFETLPAVIGIQAQDPSGVSQTGLTLNAKLDPDGHDTHYYFEWGTTTSYGATTSAPPGPEAGSAGSGTTTVSAALTDLESPGEYHYRLVASNSFGTTYGSDQVALTLPPLLPGVSETSASEVTPTTALLGAGIDPGYGPTIYRFQYGTSTTYEASTNTSEPVGSDHSVHPVSVKVTELTPGTTYHYRAIAINYSGVTRGPDQVLVTPGPPLIKNPSSGAATATSVQLQVNIDPAGSPTSYRVEYGIGPGYSSTTGETPVGGDHGDHAVRVSLNGLSPGSVYHYRVVATNQIGAEESADQSFTTAALPPAITPVPPVRCKKGFVKRRGKCAKKRAGKHRKSNKRGSSR